MLQRPFQLLFRWVKEIFDICHAYRDEVRLLCSSSVAKVISTVCCYELHDLVGR